MNERFSPDLENILRSSRDNAIKFGSDCIGTEHIMYQMLLNKKGIAIEILKKLKIDLDALLSQVSKLIPYNFEKLSTSKRNINLTKQAENAIKRASLENIDFNENAINTGHLLLGILRNMDDPTSILLNKNNIGYDSCRRCYTNISNEDFAKEVNNQLQFNNDQEEEDAEEFNITTNNKEPQSHKNTSTPVLDNFGKDLNKLAQEGKLDTVVGREKEIERVAQILSRRKKNNPVLVGEPGVGKSAIAEGLATLIVSKKAPHILLNKKIIALDLASLVAGTKYRGQFEERIKALMNEVEKNRNIILFLDEIHTIIGAGGAAGSLDAANILKPALARGEIQCIGATTLNEYRQHIEKDGALERRFQKVLVEPTSEIDTIKILNNIKPAYEKHHCVHYTDEAISACVKFAIRYISERALPDKAIDIMDEAGAKIHLKNISIPPDITLLDQQIQENESKKTVAMHQGKFEEAILYREEINKLKKEKEQAQKNWDDTLASNKVKVTEEDIAEVVSAMTGVPVKKMGENEIKKLAGLPDVIKNKIIGQDQAVEKIIKSIRRNRVGLNDANRPIGSFLFLGQTGVGKTQLAKIIAKEIFDTEDALIRVDMSEYMEKFALSRLIGSPPGYVGYEEGGQLTEKVRRKPYSVVLLDEIEKAHPDTFNMLLQILDDGYITDSLGRKIDFRNTIIIMTSNVGARQLNDFGLGVGYGTKAKNEQAQDIAKSIIEKSLKKTFSPEFLNRIDDIIMFNSLSKENIRKIVDIELQKLYERVNNIGFELILPEEVIDFIAEKGYDKQYGARPLRRAIQQYVEDVLAEEIVEKNISHNAKFTMWIDNDNLKVKEILEE